MQYTENYNLNKPELTDVADITKLSENMDIIDEELEKRTTKSGFLTDLIAHLASDAAIAISSLSTDSVFYRLLQYALNAAGVQYNFQNSSAWYICLGALFGGLIIQGGAPIITSTNNKVTFPISFIQVPIIMLNDVSGNISGVGNLGVCEQTNSNFGVVYEIAPGYMFWLAVGK